MLQILIEPNYNEPSYDIAALAGNTKRKRKLHRKSGHAPGAQGKYKIVSYCPQHENVQMITKTGELFYAVVSADSASASCKAGHTWELK